jgi:CrcB protein
MLAKLLAVGAGGFAGAVLRYGASALTLRFVGKTYLWVGTGAVNILGCLLLGALFALAQTERLASSELRLFLTVGLCGGFTTFSTFGLEFVELARTDQLALALAYALGSLALGSAAVLAGMALVGAPPTP